MSDMETKIYKASMMTVGSLMAVFAGGFLWFLYQGVTGSDTTLYFFFGLLFLAAFMYLYSNFKQMQHDLILNNKGLEYQLLEKAIGVSFVPWEEIVGVKVVRLPKGGEFVAVDLRESEFSKSLKSPSLRETFGNYFMISIANLSGSTNDIYTDIKVRIEKYSTNSQEIASVEEGISKSVKYIHAFAYISYLALFLLAMYYLYNGGIYLPIRGRPSDGPLTGWEAWLVCAIPVFMAIAYGAKVDKSWPITPSLRTPIQVTFTIAYMAAIILSVMGADKTLATYLPSLHKLLTQFT